MIRRNGEFEREVRTAMRGGKGQVTIEHLWKKEEFKSRTRLCAKLVIPPGDSIGFHDHVNEEEVYVVLAGEGRIRDGAVVESVRAGDTILTGAGAGHAVESTGTVPLEMIAFIAQY